MGRAIFNQHHYLFRYLQLAIQLAVWSVSLCMFKFEYKRALNPVFYLHPLLWMYTTAYYGAELYFQYHYTLNKGTLLYYILLICQIVVSLIASMMVLEFNDDSPYRMQSYQMQMPES